MNDKFEEIKWHVSLMVESNAKSIATLKEKYPDAKDAISWLEGKGAAYNHIARLIEVIEKE